MKQVKMAQSAKIINLLKNSTLALTILIFSGLVFAATPLLEPKTYIIGSKHASTTSTCKTSYSYTELIQNNEYIALSFVPEKVASSKGTDYFLEFYAFSSDKPTEIIHSNALKLEIDGIEMSFPLMNEPKGKYVYLPSVKSKNFIFPLKWIHMNKDVFAKVLNAKTIKYEILIDPKKSDRKSIKGIIQDKTPIFQKFKKDCNISA